jgi:hypothetical protein
MQVVRVVAIIMVVLGILVMLGALLHDLVLAPGEPMHVSLKELAVAIEGAVVLALGLILLLQRISS